MVEIIINEAQNSNDEINNQILELINLIYQDNQQTKKLLVELKDVIGIVHDNQIINTSNNKELLAKAFDEIDVVNTKED